MADPEDHRGSLCWPLGVGNRTDVNGQTTCQKCRYTVEDQRNNGSSAGRFFRALFAGSVAAGVGAGIYYAVLALTGYEFGLVAILVGFMGGARAAGS